MLRPGVTQETFYFREEAKTYCRLCQEDIHGFTAKGHIVASSRASHTNHSVRESVLEHLALLCARGYHPEDVVRSWAYILHDHFRHQRIESLSNPEWTVEQRAASVCDLMIVLREMNVIDLSLAVQGSSESNEQVYVQSRRRAAFERLECIGDNTWGANMSSRMMVVLSDRQWQYSEGAYSFNTMRDALEMNTQLEQMFDLLDIMRVLPSDIRDKIGSGKIKADVLESILGELHVTLWGFIPKLSDSEEFVEVNGVGQAGIAALVQHVLTETYDTMILALLGELAKSAIPLAEEMAVNSLWHVAYPTVMRSRDRNATRRKMTPLAGAFTLPAVPRLFERPTPAPRSAPHPLHLQTLRPDGPFISSHTKRDVFENHIRHIEQAFLVDDSLPALRCERHVPDVASLVRSLSIPFMAAEVQGDYTSLDVDPSDLYFRDKALSLKPTRPGDDEEFPNIAASSDAVTIVPAAADFSPAELYRAIFPYLATERQVLAVAVEETSEALRCPFAPSAFLPPGTKPPSAGVITDKNLCYGQYLFPELASQLDLMNSLRGKSNAYFVQSQTCGSTVTVSATTPVCETAAASVEGTEATDA
jgi:hypothetical protein